MPQTVHPERAEQKAKSYYASVIVLIAWIVVSCTPIVPATAPPQLSHTPGAFVVVSNEEYVTDAFRVQYPAGWRVIKLSPAGAPMQVAFAAPDNTSSITLNVVEKDGENSDTIRYKHLDSGIIIQAIFESSGREKIELYAWVIKSLIDS